MSTKLVINNSNQNISVLTADEENPQTPDFNNEEADTYQESLSCCACKSCNLVMSDSQHNSIQITDPLKLIQFKKRLIKILLRKKLKRRLRLVLIRKQQEEQQRIFRNVFCRIFRIVSCPGCEIMPVLASSRFQCMANVVLEQFCSYQTNSLDPFGFVFYKFADWLAITLETLFQNLLNSENFNVEP